MENNRHKEGFVIPTKRQRVEGSGHLTKRPLSCDNQIPRLQVSGFSLGMTQCLLFVLSVFLMFSPSSAHATCSNPAGAEGEQIYNSTHKVMQFCNGTGWLSMDASSLVAGGSDNLGNHTATQNIDMATRKVINMATPTAGTDAATKSYVDSVAGSGGSDDLGNHTATSTLNMGTYKITNMAGPTIGTDAATKSYVDTNLSGKADASALTTGLDTKVDLAGDTMTGDLTLVGAPTANEHAATKAYVDTGLNLKVDLAGATMGGALELFGAPTANAHAATKAYVDTVLAAGGSGGSGGRYHISCWNPMNSTGAYYGACIMIDTQTGATKCQYNGNISGGGSWNDCQAQIGITSLETTTINDTSGGDIYAANGYGWGTQDNIGDGANQSDSAPSQIDLNLTFTKIEGGRYHACGVASGKLYCWGEGASNNSSYYRPPFNTTDYWSPFATDLSSLDFPTVTDLSIGEYKGAFRIADGRWYGWGSTNGSGSNYVFGHTGGSINIARWYNTANAQVDLPNDFTKVIVSLYHMCALRANGRLHCTLNSLDNSTYEYVAGMGNSAQRSAYLDEDQYAQGGHTFVDFGISYSTTCAVADTGVAYCWGYDNSYGQHGKGDTSVGNGTPTAVDVAHISPAPNFEKIYGNNKNGSSQQHFCALTTAGKAYCWGYNAEGQLGVGDTVTRNKPTAVLGDYTFTDMALGNRHTCGRLSTGTLYCWGYGANGQLGNNSTGNKSIPEPVTGGGFVGIGSGYSSTYGWK